MINYHIFSSSWFLTSVEDVLQLDERRATADRYDSNLARIKNYYHVGFAFEGKVVDVISYTVRELPEKRNKWDNSVLLCVKLLDGRYLAKRHNNSQWLSLEYL